jgi:hypothetical protein
MPSATGGASANNSNSNTTTANTQQRQPSGGLTKSDEEVELDEVAGELDDGLDSLRTPLDTTGGISSSSKGFFSTIASGQTEAKKIAQEKARFNRTVVHYRPMTNIMSIDPRLGAAYVYGREREREREERGEVRNSHRDNTRDKGESRQK